MRGLRASGLRVIFDASLPIPPPCSNPWAMRYCAAHPDTFVFVHFLGASPASADWTALVRRFLHELNRRHHMTATTPDHPEALRKSFADALRMAQVMKGWELHCADPQLPRTLIPRLRAVGRYRRPSDFVPTRKG